MNARRFRTIILLAVGILLAVAVGPAGLCGGPALGEDAQPAAAQRDGAVVLYLFHRARLSSDSRQMKDSIGEALQAEFGEELADGQLAFRTVDFEAPRNRGLADRFKVTQAALLLVKWRDGEVSDWRNLEKAWTLLKEAPAPGMGDGETPLATYVLHHTRAYLHGPWLALLLLGAAALGLGVFTAVQPCPMATNIAAISFIARQVGSARSVLTAGLLYAAGRTLAYVALAVLLVGGLTQLQIKTFLHQYLDQLLGPILVLVAMFLLGLIRLNVSGPAVGEKMQQRVEAWGIWAALPLGVVFALSFCPISAGCFFFSLFALTAASDSWIVLPSLYGIGTALPVVGFAVLVAFSTQSVGKAFNVATQVQWWSRRIMGMLFLLMGIYFCLEFSFGIPIRKFIGL